jgi:hypothetical protein
MPCKTIEKLVVMAATALALLTPSGLWAQAGGFWSAIDRHDLKLDDNPKQAGASAMVLDYWDEVNNYQANERVTIRIKVFRDEGMKYANVEIPYFAKYMQIEDIRARAVSPQGKSSEFNGGVIEKESSKPNATGSTQKR